MFKRDNSDKPGQYIRICETRIACGDCILKWIKPIDYMVGFCSYPHIIEFWRRLLVITNLCIDLNENVTWFCKNA